MLNLPGPYLLSVVVAAALLVHGCMCFRASWAIPYLGVVFTVSAWYLVEPIYLPEEFTKFAEADVTAAYYAVFLSLLTFGVVTPMAVNFARPKLGDFNLGGGH